MTDCHEANLVSLSVARVDDSEAANTKLPQAGKFAKQRLATFWIGGDSAYRCHNGSFQVGMKRADDLSNMRRDVGPKEPHAVRRFFAGVNG